MFCHISLTYVCKNWGLMLTIYIFYKIEMSFTVRGKHRQARLIEPGSIPNAKLMTITFIKSTALSIKIVGHSFVQISSGKTVSTKAGVNSCMFSFGFQLIFI